MQYFVPCFLSLSHLLFNSASAELRLRFGVMRITYTFSLEIRVPRMHFFFSLVNLALKSLFH